MVMEIWAFHLHHSVLGLPVSYPLLCLHLASDVRYNELFIQYPEFCPPVVVDRKVLSYCCHKIGLFEWQKKQQRTGRTKNITDPDAVSKRIWALILFCMMKYWVRQEELIGKVVECSRDESFCHACKMSDFGLCAMDINGKPLNKLSASARDGGEMICMSSVITRWGIVQGFMGEDPANGTIMITSRTWRQQRYTFALRLLGRGSVITINCFRRKELSWGMTVILGSTLRIWNPLVKCTCSMTMLRTTTVRR